MRYWYDAGETTTNKGVLRQFLLVDVYRERKLFGSASRRCTLLMGLKFDSKGQVQEFLHLGE